MNLERWHRIGEIYHSALPLLPPERSAFVAGVCGDDAQLQREVNSLLEADESSGTFLETAVFDLGLRILMDDNLKSSDNVPARDLPESDTLIGVILDDRYAIERKLGHGGVGAVYLARDRKLHDKRVVVKVLLEKSLQDEWVVLKFEQEKEALARVDHPGVVGIIDTGELSDGKPYIVMQYIEGIALREAIKDRPEGMDLERAASIVRQIGVALAAVHQKKIYHRDLKPENIMLQALGRGDEQVKIVDFGIAKIKESVVAPSTVTGAATAGTIVYMSPEQLRGEKLTAASDIYALAVIAYEMVTGRRPFNPETIAHLAEMQRQGVRARPSDLRPRLSEGAQSIILRGLAFDPRVRHQSAAEFGEELARALMNEEETLKYRKAEIELPPTQLSIDTSQSRPETNPQSSKTMMAPFEPARPHTFDPPAMRVEPQDSQRRWPIVVGLLVLLAAFGLGGYFVIAKRDLLLGSGAKTTATAPSSQRSLAYSLTVQKVRDGKPYKEPFESSGQEIFENGYKFRLNVSSPQAGYLYVFNEGAAEQDGTEFTIIYPTPATNNGGARLDANQNVQTNWNTFAGETGTEKFWMIWSATAVAQLESAKDDAFKSKEGAVTDAALVKSIKEFLAKHSNPTPETAKDTTKQHTNVRGSGDVLVKLVELEHR
ncbi:MAG: eukaryotic-like serine/threonine-protein kinase [Blastocatellia bacterium]|nr:eukaryotic-like serine/threonine-protein kinase [Blastocatellia bacterium]